jgi:hypothetical protein
MVEPLIVEISLSRQLTPTSLPFPGVGGQLRAWLGAKAPLLMTVVLGSLALVPSWIKLISLEGEGEQELTGVTDIQK